MNGIAKTVRGNLGVVREAAIELHPNLQFTIEEIDINVELAFLDLNEYSDSHKQVKNVWSQKTTHGDTLIYFRGYALLQYKRNIIKNRNLRSSSTWVNLTEHRRKIVSSRLRINIQKNGRRG